MSVLITIFSVNAATSLMLISFIYPLMKRFLMHSYRPWGPKHHLKKERVPTGGGIILLILSVIGTFLIAILYQEELSRLIPNHSLTLNLVVFIPLLFGLVGLADDFMKSRTGTTGIKARYKLIAQILLSLAFLHLAYPTSSTTLIPFVEGCVKLPYWAFMSLGTFLILLIVNGSNFSDGLDGLLGGLSLICTISLLIPLGILAGTLMPFNISLVENSFILQGGLPLFSCYFLAGFAGGITSLLIVNFKPAHLYFGDTGSYFIGAFLSVIAILNGFIFYLFILGAVAGIEVLSVVLQVIYFRLTKGKRIFKMSPLHHHFELSGLSELGTVFIFWGLELITALIAFSGFFLSLP